MARLSTLSAADVRRAVVAAQGFDGRTRTRPAGSRQLMATARDLSVVQIDSVNVVVRAQYFPFFARRGPYDMEALDRLAYGPPRRRQLFEFWAHEASLLPVELWPLSRWRMDVAERRWGGRYVPDAAARAYVEAVYQEVVDRGPLAASELSQQGERSGPWWGWAPGKRALEWLFRIGRVTTATRRNFERVYDLPERVLPPEVVAAPAVPEPEARRQLLLRAAGALGVATAADLADYFRQQLGAVKPLLAEMVAAGELTAVEVEGWRERAYVATATFRVPRPSSVDGVRALVAPFDSLAWERKRLERVFGFAYRIEIYVPAPKRVHGYYVYPFLLGDHMVARVDLKADRQQGRLRVHGAFGEPVERTGIELAEVAAALAAELELVAEWLGLDNGVGVGDRGDLAALLAHYFDKPD